MSAPLNFHFLEDEPEHFEPIALESGIQLQGNQVKAFRMVAALIRSGGSLFLTGRAGTGKSAVVKALREFYKTIVAAPTGLAALNVEGVTLHSLCGIRPGHSFFKVPDTLPDVLMACDLVVIDEISMVRADILDAVDRCFRAALSSDLPFGGKAVLFVGDFWQISPVTTESDPLPKNYISPFAFHSAVWVKSNPEIVELDQIWRQTDPEFVAALNDVRSGGSALMDTFNARIAKPEPDTLRLVFTNKRSKEINSGALALLEGEDWEAKGTMSGNFLSEELPCDVVLTLRKGARVMVTKNLENGLVNGDLGTVLNIYPGAIVILSDRLGVATIGRARWRKIAIEPCDTEGFKEKETGSFSQFPLKLAYAVTVHKSQGQTYDRCHLELERQPFAHGLLYVALSRCKTLEGLTIGRRITWNDHCVDTAVPNWIRTPRFGGWDDL